MSIPRAKMNEAILISVSMVPSLQEQSRDFSALGTEGAMRQLPGSEGPSAFIGEQNVVDACDCRAGQTFKSFRNDGGDFGKTNASIEKRCYGNLIGCVKHRRCRSPRPQRFVSKPNTGKAAQIERFKLKARDLHQVERRDAGGDAFGITQSVSDGRATVGVSQLREHRPAEEANIGMN